MFDPESCPHEHLNQQGSTKTTCRLFRVDCQTYVHEEPRTEKSAQLLRARAGKKAAPAPMVDIRPNAKLNMAQASEVAKAFPMLLKSHIKNVPKDSQIDQRQLEALLQDAVELVVEASAEAAGEPPGPNLALMHCTKRSNHPVHLPVVDIAEDPRLFAILDEGCNSTCHTKSWAAKARNVLQGYGKELGPCRGSEKYYKGLGGAKSMGKRNVPWGIRLTGSYIEGNIMSNELNRPEHYMLLSLHAQVSLGFVKETATGTCFCGSPTTLASSTR